MHILALRHTHTCHVTALESPLSSLCVASHAVTLRHTTHMRVPACVCMFSVAPAYLHTGSLRGLCVGGESGEQ